MYEGCGIGGCFGNDSEITRSGGTQRRFGESGPGKGIVTLGGEVRSEWDKAQAKALAKSHAGTQVVADQIAVVPKGVEKEAKAVNSDLDEGIEKNLDAALIVNRMHGDVRFDVRGAVVTLTGDVNSQYKREHAEQVATRVPNVKQVVNALQVKNQKASSSH
jgi:osmotically-inducible protein OsmY